MSTPHHRTTHDQTDCRWRWLIVCLCLTLATTAPASAVTAQDKVTDSDAIPRLDDWPVTFGLSYSFHTWRLRTGAAERLRTAPVSPITVRWLSRAGQVGDALVTIRRIVDERPDLIAQAFDEFREDVRRDRARGYVEQARTLLGAARARLADLPREQRAKTARAMILLEQQTDSSTQWADRLREFVTEYDGTHAATLASMDLVMSPRLSMDSLSALDDFVTKYPGTDVAAKALHTKAFHISHNARALGLDKVGSDPADRLLDVLQIASELRSGKYPTCQWVEEAPKLVTEFSFLKVTLTPESAAKVTAALLEFVRASFHLADDPNQRESFLHLLSRTIPTVVAMTADGPPAVDRVFDELEQSAPNPPLVRFAKARSRVNPMANPPSTPEGRKSAEAILADVAAMGTGPFSQRALVELAELDYGEQRFAQARDRFSTFLERYPKTDFAWAVAIRVGQSQAALGRHEEAVRMFRGASKSHGSVPFAIILGSAYAARTLEILGRFDQALARYRESLTVWTSDLGGQLGATGRYSPGIQWWNSFFPARPGHWSGYDLLSNPSFTSVEFTNAERTRALVPVAVGYSGGTVVLEKVNGVWTLKELVNQWVM